MSLKILGGIARGFALQQPSSQKTRPTSALLKRKFFDANQDLSDFEFIDLCAGTGSIGLEALSRGSKKVYLVESDKRVFNILKQNKQKLIDKYFNDDELSCDLFFGDYKKWLKSHSSILNSSSIVFFDPPYEKIDEYRKFFKLMAKIDLKVMFIVEACEQKTLRLDAFVAEFGNPDKIYKQGTHFFALYNI